MKRIAIFASGTGSNAEKIIQHFKNHPSVEVALVISNRKNALVLEKAKAHSIKTQIVEKTAFYNTSSTISLLQAHNISLIVLAGFLWLIPDAMIKAFPKKIINIHPSLLPQFGGKGMYGMNVHQAVHESKVAKTGITIHFVNEKYDEGEIIFQKSIQIEESDTPKGIAQKVLRLEHQFFAPTIEGLLIR